jgi:hypothetical protein
VRCAAQCRGRCMDAPIIDVLRLEIIVFVVIQVLFFGSLIGGLSWQPRAGGHRGSRAYKLLCWRVSPHGSPSWVCWPRCFRFLVVAAHRGSWVGSLGTCTANSALGEW